MKKYFKTILLSILGFLFFSFAGVLSATPTTLDRVSNFIQPLIPTDYFKVSYLVATTTTATSTFAGSLQVNGGTLFVNANNNRVGVGTTTPASTLSVNGDLTTVATSTITQVWKIQNSNFQDRARWVYDSGGIDLKLNYPVTNTNVMTWDLNGNVVGIGTSSPYATLSVTNTQANPSFVVEDSTSPDTTPFIIDASGNVGVGTTSPGSLFNIRGSLPTFTITDTSNTSGSVGDSLSNINFVGEDTSSGLNGTVRASIGTYAADVFRAQVGLNFMTRSGVTLYNRMVIEPNFGNVGIGTTTPYAKLAITNTGSDPSFVVEDSTSPDTTPFIIDASGLVGIGTTSPVTKLHVMDTGAGTFGGLSIQRSDSTTGSEAQLNFTVSTAQPTTANSNGGRISVIRQGAGAQSDMTFALTNTAGVSMPEIMRLQGSTGNVGIGTTTPVSKLNVQDTSGGFITLNSSDISMTKGDNLGGLDFYSLDSSASMGGIWGRIRYEANALWDGTTGDGADLIFSTRTVSAGSLKDKMVLTAAGDVAIGTTSPDIFSTGLTRQLTVTTDAASVSSASLAIAGGTTGTARIDLGNESILRAGIQAIDGSDLRFLTNSTNSGTTLTTGMTLKSSGYLGIGTTSPNWKLSVAGIGSFDDYVRASYFISTSTATSTFTGGISTNLLNVTSTTATSTFANGINLSKGCFSINNTCVSGGAGSGTVNTGAANYFAYYPSGGTTVDDQTVLNIVSGNIGIGTTTPSKLLAVGGDILGNNIISSYFTATSTLATSTFYGPVDASSLTVRSPRASRGLLLGDSTTAAYLGMSGIDTFLATSSDTVLGTQITNDAVAGDTISQQQTAWTNDTNKAKYDWIMVMVGLNDYASATSTIISDYQTLINTINSGKKESAVIIVATTLPAKQRYIDLLGQSAGLQAFSKVSALNEAVMGGGSTPITGVSFRINKHYNALSDGAGNLALAYDSGDGIHENNLGRQLIAKVFRESLNNIGYLTNTPSGIVSDYWVNNGTSIYLKSANPTINTTNLGIGTTSPGSLFSIGAIANFASTTSSLYSALKVTNTGSGNTLVIEDSASDTSPFLIDSGGNIGIGTTTPAYLTHLNFNTDGENGLAIENSSGGTSAGSAFYLKNSAGKIGGMNILSPNHVASWLAGQTNILSQSGLILITNSNVASGGTDPIFFYTGGYDSTNERMRLTSTGLGIATTSPWRKLSVVGGVAFNGLTSSTAGNAVCILTNFDVVTAGGTTCTTSSAKTKHGILTINESTARKIMKLRPVEYVSNESNEERYGFIAEEVAKIDPKLVEYAKSDITLFDGQVIKKGEPLSVDYNRYTGLLTKFVQDIYNGLQKLIAKVAGLENKLNKQQQEIDLLKVEIEKLKVNINK